jgi:hypothetical protein
MTTDAKQKTKTVQMIGHDSDDFENRLVKGKKDFTLRFSNYTTIIETNGYKYLFSNSHEKK